MGLFPDEGHDAIPERGLRERKTVRFNIIEEHRSAFSVGRMCHVMDVSPRRLPAFCTRPASRKQRSDMMTLAHIKEHSRLSLGSYDRPRMTEELKEISLTVGRRRVGRLMLQNSISVVRHHCPAIVCLQTMREAQTQGDNRQQSQVQHRA